MTQQGGDRAYPAGDEITVKNTEGSAINPGEWVSITGHDGDHPEVKLADSNASQPVMGVASADAGGADDGELLKIVLRGVPWARVDSGMTAGNEVAAPDSSLSGEDAGIAESGGSTDYYLVDDAQELVSGSGNYFAPVHLN